MIHDHPEVAFRDCQHCLKYQYDEYGEVMKDHRTGLPEERWEACQAPCRTQAGCPKGTPEEPKTLWPDSVLCYEHYLQCKAVGKFPDDAVVMRNAAVILQIEDQSAANLEAEYRQTVVNLLARRANG